MQDYRGLFRAIQDYMDEYRGVNSFLERLIKTGDRHVDTQNLWNLNVLTHLNNIKIKPISQVGVVQNFTLKANISKLNTSNISVV